MGALQEKLWQAATSDEGDLFPVPSGQTIRLQDVFWEEGDTLTLRVRFLAPQIARAGGTIGYELAKKDMQHLCETFVLPQLKDGTDVPDQIIISLSDIEVPFGEADPESTQFFEAYQVQGEACIWEVF